MVLFKETSIVLEITMVILWNYNFWRRKFEFNLLIKINSAQTKTNSKIVGIFLCIFSIALVLLERLAESFEMEPELKTLRLKLLPVEQNGFLDWDSMISIFKLMGQYFTITLNSCFDVFISILAVQIHSITAIYLEKIGCKASQVNFQSQSSRFYETESVIKETQELRDYFTILNDFNSLLVLCWFCMGLPWVPSRLVENVIAGDNTTLNVFKVLYTWTCIIIYIVAGVLFAEARSKVYLCGINEVS